MKKIKYTVTFYSPGTFFSETTEKDIKLWDVVKALELAKDVEERYSAKPYGFSFTTYETYGPIVEDGVEFKADQKKLESSGIYYITGKVESAKEILSRTDSDERILRSNIECNNIKAIVTNTNSWKFTGEFRKGDFVVDWDGNILDSGINYD